MIVGGTFTLPAAHAFGDPGFHQVVTVVRRLPRGPGGRRVIVSLRDASRPRQRCSEDHPLSGCATVDWSDDPSRPKVPPSGVFRNSVTIGLRTLHLRCSGALARTPQPFRPG